MGLNIIDKNNIINSEEVKEIKYKIYDELESLKYDFSYIGTEYMAEIIYILYYLDRNFNCNFQKEIYPLLAIKYETSINSIRSAVAFATEKMFFDCVEEYLKEYINDYKFKKPGPKKVAFSVIKKIKEKV